MSTLEPTAAEQEDVLLYEELTAELVESLFIDGDDESLKAEGADWPKICSFYNEIARTSKYKNHPLTKETPAVIVYEYEQYVSNEWKSLNKLPVETNQVPSIKATWEFLVIKVNSH
ncbi:hypothetical protein GGF46_004898 [Coemansia sp. RSA 552]|nr:hypothetical protein GGF46_004898 [Coemansia sp. RSA 552]